MKRRMVVAGLCALAIAPAAAAQPRVPKIGILLVGNPEPALGMLRSGLRERGYIEGSTIVIELRSAESKPGLLPSLAAELVRLKVDLIVAVQTPAIQAAKEATRDIPIVMAGAGDPVGTGLVASLARPGGNITGMSGATAAVAGKTLEVVRVMLPSARRLVALLNASDPFTKPLWDQLQLTSRNLDLRIEPIYIREVSELDTAFSRMERAKVDVVFLQPSLQRQRAIDLGLKHRLPVVCPTAGFAQAGGLMAHSASSAELHREAVGYVEKILKGRKPADLPVQQATKFDLVINLKTARALGITIPDALLVRADEVIR
jgi:ABC-type uncharacterized transport system substrate-binding protein